tara:strand:- start:220 stop:582 length:363 start_codon:yes stop_codon:yes gene_type:complete
MLDTKRNNISGLLGMDKAARSERVPPVPLEEVSGQRISPPRFPNNRTPIGSRANIHLHRETPTGCNVQGFIQGRPQKEIEYGYKFLDPEQRMSLLMEYTSSRQNRNFGTVASFGAYDGLK